MWTVLQLVGALLVVAGVAMMSVPVSLVVAGVLAFMVGFVGEA